ncbi:MAG: hypothetical protein AB8B55_21300 [Mariniblastus sp.]
MTSKIRRFGFAVVLMASVVGCLLASQKVNAQENKPSESKAADASSSESLAAEPKLSEPDGTVPKKLFVFGSVSDEDDHPVVGARVMLFGPAGRSMSAQELAQLDPAMVETATDSEGNFRLEFDAYDVRFLGEGNCTLVVQAEGLGLSVTNCPHVRLMVDLPMELSLKPVQDTLVKVVDSNGKAIKNASVSPGNSGKVIFPFGIARRFEVKTDEQGMARMQNLTSETGQVYVHGDSIGYQYVRIGATTGNYMKVSLEPMATMNATLKLPDSADMTPFTKTQWFALSTKTLAYSPTGPESFGWVKTNLSQEGKLTAANLAIGSVAWITADDVDSPYRDSTFFEHPKLTVENSPFDVSLNYIDAAKIVFKVTDKKGNPLPRISVNTKMTNEDGIASLYLPGNFPSNQAFAFDALLRYKLTDPFGVIWKKKLSVESDNVIAIRMTPSQVIIGRTVGSDGTPMSGVTVTGTYGEERFTNKSIGVSDRNGNFVLRSLPPSAAVEISARKDAYATDAKAATRVVTNEKATTTELVLVEQKVASFAGKLVDENNELVSSVEVSIGKAVVIQQESFGAERLQQTKLLGNEQPVSTDSNGVFRFNPTSELNGRFQIKVDDPRYFPFRSSFIDAGKFAAAGEEIQFGDFQLTTRPADKRIEIRLKDEVSNDPVADGEFVLIGYRAGKTFGKTGDNGFGTATVAVASQLLVVSVPGYEVVYKWLKKAELATLENEILVSLKKLDPKLQSKKLEWFERRSDDYLAAGKELFGELEQPSPKESSFYRQSMYFDALAMTNIDRYIELVESDDSPYEYRGNFFQQQHSKAFFYAPEKLLEITVESDWPGFQKALLLASLAFQTSDRELKDELYGEAISLSRSLSGRNKYYVAGELAKHLLLDGQLDSAKQIIAEVWAESKDLQKQLADKKEKMDIGMSRVFCPMLALVDPDAAIGLVPLMATQTEIERLLGQAMAVVSYSDVEKYSSLVDSNKVVSATGVALLEPTYLTQELLKMRQPSQQAIAWLNRIGDTIPNQKVKLQIALARAKFASSPSERKSRFENAISILKNGPTKIVQSYFYDPTYEVTQWAISFAELSQQEIDQLFFETAKLLPNKFEKFGELEVLAINMRLLSLRDAGLAKQILEPVFDNPSWLFRYQTGQEFRGNFVVGTSVWIDPVWANKATNELISRLEKDSSARQIELINSALLQTHEIVKQLRMVENSLE